MADYRAVRRKSLHASINSRLLAIAAPTKVSRAGHSAGRRRTSSARGAVYKLDPARAEEV